jgi:hypothetical protein
MAQGPDDLDEQAVRAEERPGKRLLRDIKDVIRYYGIEGTH